MFGRLMPKEGKFFDLFNAHAEQIVVGGNALVSFIANLGKDEQLAAQASDAVDTAEAQADKITHDTISLLHSTFITPLDRDEIHSLINALDDILDLIQDVTQTVSLYDIRESTAEAVQLADLCMACCTGVQQAVSRLRTAEQRVAILKTCEEIDRLESEADRVMRSAMSRLFRDEPDVRQIIKLKAMYELLETVTDRCEDVANILEGIVLENA